MLVPGAAPAQSVSAQMPDGRFQPAAVTSPTVLNRIFTTRDPSVTGCQTPSGVDYFTNTDTRIHLWLSVAGIRGGDPVSIVWTFPSGATERSNFTAGFSGTGCMWSSINLNGRFGDWAVTMLVNGSTVGGPHMVPVLGPNHPQLEEVRPSGNWKLAHVSPNAWAVVRGLQLASAPFPSIGSDLPTEAAGVRVTVNGVPAPLVWAADRSVEFQVPAGVRGDSITVRAHTGWGASNILRVPLTTVSPGLLWNDDGSASVVRAGTAVSRGAPVERGDLITIRALGLGAVARAPRDGQLGVPATDAFYTPMVTLGGVGLEVVRTVMADVPGLYWVSVRIPPEVPSGNQVPLRLAVNGIEAPTLHLPVRAPGPSFARLSIDRIEHPTWNGPARDNGVYNPASQIVIRASNLRPNAPAFLRCTGSGGFSAESPVVSIAGQAATAIVPPYYDAASGTYLSGTATCVLVQRVADLENVSPSFSFRIQSPPLPRGQPGALTLALLQSAAQGPQQVHANLTLKDRSTGGISYSAANTREQMNAAVAAYTPYIDAVRQIANGSATSVNLGTSEMGQPLVVTRDEVARLDRWIAMIMEEVDASSASGESVNAASDDITRLRPAGFLSSLGRGLLDCHNPLSWLDFQFGNRTRSPQESCDATRDAVAALPAAAGGALVQAGAEVSDFVERVETTVRWLPIPGVAQARVIAIVGRMASIASAAKIGTAVVGSVISGLSGRSDSQSLLSALWTGVKDTVVRPFAEDTVDQIGRAFFGEEAWDIASDAEDVREVPVPSRFRNSKVDGHEAEMLGPSAVRSGDGSYSLVSDPAPGPLTVIRGRASFDGQPLREAFVEFGEGSRLTAPGATAATNLDGTFEMLVPRSQLGGSVPPSASLIYNVRVPGQSSYQGLNTGTITVGSSTMTLPAVSIVTQPGGGNNGGGDNCGGAICARPAN
jgi:uncharacterized protein (TIGR03437 family)